jgi:hypothetical protein
MTYFMCWPESSSDIWVSTLLKNMLKYNMSTMFNIKPHKRQFKGLDDC